MTRPLVLCVCLLTAGCGYMLGSPNHPGIRAVHVPVFTSESHRRNLEYLLTEAVQREIKQRSEIRLENSPLADTILRGHIVDVRKDSLGETSFDDPRELQLSIGVHVTWEDRRTGRILAEQHFPFQPDVRHEVGEADFAPEVGQSFATAAQTATNRLAYQIVDLLEMPW